VACPLCRKEFEVPDGKLAALPTNFFIEKLLEIKKISGASASKDTPCDVCSSDETTDVGAAAVKAAAMYCIDCQQNLCQQCCNSWHRKVKATSSHKTIELGSQLQSESLLLEFPPSSCDIHKNDLLRLYCFDCKVASCVICYVESHNTHKCSDINKVGEEFRNAIKIDISDTADEITKNRELLQTIEKEQNEFIEQVRKAEIEIARKQNNGSK
jgi:hypothetical protein